MTSHWWLPFIILMLAGCAGAEVGGQCHETDECVANLECFMDATGTRDSQGKVTACDVSTTTGKCQQACRADADCGAGKSCSKSCDGSLFCLPNPF